MAQDNLKNLKHDTVGNSEASYYLVDMLKKINNYKLARRLLNIIHEFYIIIKDIENFPRASKENISKLLLKDCLEKIDNYEKLINNKSQLYIDVFNLTRNVIKTIRKIKIYK